MIKIAAAMAAMAAMAVAVPLLAARSL